MSSDSFNLDKDVIDPAALELYATAFLLRFFQFLKLTELHDSSNAIFDEATTALMGTYDTFISVPGQNQLDLTFRGEHIFINKIRLRPRPRQFHVYRHFLKVMRRKKVGSLHFKGRLDRERMKFFLWTLTKAEYSESVDQPAEVVAAQLKEKGIHEIEVRRISKLHEAGLGKIGEEEGASDVELAIALVYRNLLQFCQICFDNLDKASKLITKPYEALMEDLAALTEEDLVQLLRLNAIKRYDRPLVHRGVNTAFMMVTWATSLGLPKGVSLELVGLSLLHPLTLTDHGGLKASISADESADVLDKLERLRNVWPSTELQQLALFEWMQNYGDAGVYKLGSQQVYLHFFSRMLRIVSDYDRLTTIAPGASTLLPDEALASMMKAQGVYDPTLIKLFVNWLGIYPVGSLVQLNTGEIAQVFAGASDPTKFQRPLVMIVKDSQGRKLERPEIFDLTVVNEKLGTYRKSIKKSITLEDGGLTPSDLKVTPVSI